jgi:hypothetical protein
VSECGVVIYCLVKRVNCARLDRFMHRVFDEETVAWLLEPSHMCER